MALTIVIAYYVLLLVVSRVTSRQASNNTFFSANKRSPWLAVAFGMLGASLSGVTFVSVPGMVESSDMTYLQMCIGFIPGYLIVAFVLLPLYYRLRLTSIYTYLQERFDAVTYRTGASFFLLSKMLGAAVRIYLVVLILQRLVFDNWGVPFGVSTVILLLLIWVYTRKGGIGTIVWTDCLQTVVLLAALVLILYSITSAEGYSLTDTVRAIAADEHSRIFVFDDWTSRQYFWKQLLSGAFIVVVMTGLDQDMMQKNLTCRDLRSAQKNMVLNSVLYLPANLLFLSLGVLMYAYIAHHGLQIDAHGDDVLPMLCASGALGTATIGIFTLGIVAAAFSSADSALTSLTTSVCIDIYGRYDDVRLRRRVHVAVVCVMLIIILAFRALNNHSVIDAVYIIASYTYGPLLGLFTFGLFVPSDVRPRPHAVPWICIAAPCLCYALSYSAARWWNYHFGYELLIINGLLTMLGLFLSRLHSGIRPSASR